METTYIEKLERERQTPFTEAQRKYLLYKLKEIEDQTKILREYPLEDGGSEPATVFHPLCPESKWSQKIG